MTGFLLPGLKPDQTEAASRVLRAALDAADPRAAARRALSRAGDRLEVTGPSGRQSLELSHFKRVRVVGAGKAAQAMARGLLDVLGERVSAGLLITKHISGGPESLPARVRVLPGGHPVPSVESVTSTRALVEFLRAGWEQGAGDALDDALLFPQNPGSGLALMTLPEDELLFCLISGGGSALMTLPVEGVSLADMQELTRLLLACGADIGEINTLRKHLDQIKGGGLARMAAPARVVTLILSDVIGSPLDVIASGPTVADPTTYADAIDILHKYEIEDRVPTAVRQVLERGASGRLPETVKPGDAALDRVTNQVEASNPQAAEAALAEARALGFHTLLLTTSLDGEASDAGGKLGVMLRNIAAKGQPLPRPACVVAGGETTVTLRGKGTGGRNQEMALAAAVPISGLRDVAVITLGTDGEDGPTDAAGAVVTGETLRRARKQGLDPQAYLQDNDSYHFFSALGDLLITGPTGTNVNDLVFMFAF